MPEPLNERVLEDGVSIHGTLASNMADEPLTAAGRCSIWEATLARPSQGNSDSPNLSHRPEQKRDVTQYRF